MPTVTREQVLDALHAVLDAELGIDIVDLALVYDVEITDDLIRVAMTMTSRSCPLHAQMTQDAEGVLRARFPQVPNVRVDLVWEPQWGPDMMSDEVKKRLGWR